MAAHVRSCEQQEGVSVELSLSTSGIGLDDEVIATLEEYRIGCQVSIDGPPAIHNANRPTPAGEGSYERVIAGVRRLLAARPGRVTARVTASHAAIDLPGMVDHLLSLGFSSVHVEPCVGGDVATAVTGADIEAMCAQNAELATLLLERVRSDRVFAYHNLVRFIRHTRVVRQRLAHHCGAARTMAALARDGGDYPCHRFVGMPEYRMGDVERCGGRQRNSGAGGARRRGAAGRGDHRGFRRVRKAKLQDETRECSAGRGILASPGAAGFSPARRGGSLCGSTVAPRPRGAGRHRSPCPAERAAGSMSRSLITPGP